MLCAVVKDSFLVQHIRAACRPRPSRAPRSVCIHVLGKIQSVQRLHID